MYHACKRPGIKPRTERKMLMNESAEQIPLLTQTGRGGNIRARTPRKISEPCMASAVASQESRTTCYAVDSGEDLSKSKRRESCGDSKESKSFQIGCK